MGPKTNKPPKTEGGEQKENEKMAKMVALMAAALVPAMVQAFRSAPDPTPSSYPTHMNAYHYGKIPYKGGGGGGSKGKGKGKGKGYSNKGLDEEDNDNKGTHVRGSSIYEPIIGRKPCYMCSFYNHQGKTIRSLGRSRRIPSRGGGRVRMRGSQSAGSTRVAGASSPPRPILR